MKKSFLLLVLFVVLAFNSYAQYNIGINVLPFISINRVSSDLDTISFSNNGVNYKLGAGIVFDIEMKENYVFNTGIYWFPKSVGLQVTTPNGSYGEEFTLQYLQLPLNLKLYTDEFSIDKRFFFQVGPTFEVKISETQSDAQSEIYIEKFTLMDISLNLGIGIEMKLGPNTSFLAGVTYYRGLINSIKTTGVEDDKVKVKNDMLALNLGIKF